MKKELFIINDNKLYYIFIEVDLKGVKRKNKIFCELRHSWAPLACPSFCQLGIQNYWSLLLNAIGFFFRCNIHCRYSSSLVIFFFSFYDNEIEKILSKLNRFFFSAAFIRISYIYYLRWTHHIHSRIKIYRISFLRVMRQNKLFRWTYILWRIKVKLLFVCDSLRVVAIVRAWRSNRTEFPQKQNSC